MAKTSVLVARRQVAIHVKLKRIGERIFHVMRYGLRQIDRWSQWKFITLSGVGIFHMFK